MKVNKLIKELKKIRNEYGNVEVKTFDYTAWDRGADDDNVEIDAISYLKNDNIIVIF